MSDIGAHGGGEGRMDGIGWGEGDIARHGACAVKNRRREEFSFSLSLSLENVSARVVTRASVHGEGSKVIIPSHRSKSRATERNRGRFNAFARQICSSYVGTSIPHPVKSRGGLKGSRESCPALWLPPSRNLFLFSGKEERSQLK